MTTNVSTQLSELGQINIPPIIRETLHWQKGIELTIEITPSGLLIQPKQHQVKKRRLEELRGLLKHQGEPISDEELLAPINYMQTK